MHQVLPTDMRACSLNSERTATMLLEANNKIQVTTSSAFHQMCSHPVGEKAFLRAQCSQGGRIARCFLFTANAIGRSRQMELRVIEVT